MLAACAAFAFTLSQPVFAEEGHDHEHGHDHDHAKKIAGPNGGRILTGIEPRLEFFVTADRKIKITAVNEKGEAVALAEQQVTLVGGSRSNPTNMKFTKDGDSLVSDKALPEGNNIPVIVTIMPKPGADKVMQKFNLNLNDCPECSHKEYACTCDHDH